MRQDLLTADEVAELLGLHVRTVRNYVRDGRLHAVRIGKQYRIARADLEAFTGSPAGEASAGRQVEATSIVEVESVDPGTADRVSTLLTAAASGRPDRAQRLRVDTIYDPRRARLKVVVVGDLSATAHVLELINAIVEEPGT
ncbi:helix-turn-helix domain-containing protein [Amycolatopsis antarctica]|uniref:helix-turn-helix domain-containing protein n=1 Tax=Amycolatopsis antarctica TaxID=1854586 RepID=UPI0013FE33FB|nr:helix-turn-helix domain-containing protein [Amycolatopsis antarctica]